MFKKRKKTLKIGLAQESFVDSMTNLQWSKGILKKQNAIAEIIMGNNMFLATTGSKYEKDYIEYKLEPLISDVPLYNSSEFPLFFLLQLVDTLDPYKWFANKLPNVEKRDLYRSVLRNIRFCISDNTFTVYLEEPLSVLNEDYSKYLKNQECWLPIEVHFGGGYIEIRIK